MRRQVQPFSESSSSTPDSRNSYFTISPPLINSSNPWATTEADLLALYNCASTGAVTTRTSLWSGFQQDPNTYQYTFFSPSTGHSTSKIDITSYGEGRPEKSESRVKPEQGVLDHSKIDEETSKEETSSLNTLGYSPIPFEEYVKTLVRLSKQGSLKPVFVQRNHSPKPFIISVTGTAPEVAKCYAHLINVQNALSSIHSSQGSNDQNPTDLIFMMEINLSCPNIPDKPPPAYDGAALKEYIHAIGMAKDQTSTQNQGGSIHVGIKTPPYTYSAQFTTLTTALEESSRDLPSGCPISFITATNTLGSSLVLNENHTPALGSANGSGIGGLAGSAIHALSLGNVKTIREMLDRSSCAELKKIVIIGIGGVGDGRGFERMRSVGAEVVGVGTALGVEGVGVFGRIERKVMAREGEVMRI